MDCTQNAMKRVTEAAKMARTRNTVSPNDVVAGGLLTVLTCERDSSTRNYADLQEAAVGLQKECASTKQSYDQLHKKLAGQRKQLYT